MGISALFIAVMMSKPQHQAAVDAGKKQVTASGVSSMRKPEFFPVPHCTMRKGNGTKGPRPVIGPKALTERRCLG